LGEHLKEKSKSNFNAAKLLVNKQYNAPSVHCYYYSTLQLMKYFLLLKDGKSEIEFDKKAGKAEQGSHNWIHNEMVMHLFKSDFAAANTLKTDIAKLKRLRIDSDYKNKSMAKKDSQKAEELAVKLLNILNENFIR